ncbi:MAG: hypothetical protein LBR37_00645 [Erysipelotrichaceae bacterium]|jgi:hypothetical protein|nr:hypothetical protein [Erysipelotrichaceae bacterium]
MKLKRLVLPLILMVPLLFGCHKEELTPTPLIYGSVDKANSYQEITYERAALMIRTNAQNLVLAVGDLSGTCACWGQFELVLQDYAINNNVIIYAIDYFSVIVKEDKLGLTLIEGTPAIHIFEQGKVKQLKVYSNQNTDPIFTDGVAFKTWFESHTIKPVIMYLSKSQLDEMLLEEGHEFMLYYTRYTCPHCQIFSFSDEVINYFNDKKDQEMKVGLYAIELGGYNQAAMTHKARGDNPDTPDLETDYWDGFSYVDDGSWQMLKFELGMGNLKPDTDEDGKYIINEIPTTERGKKNRYELLATNHDSWFGKGVGYTPSWSYVKTTGKGGMLRDSIVDFASSFDGTLTKNTTGDYVVSNSWYSAARVPHLPFLVTDGDAINDGRIVPQSDVVTQNNVSIIRSDKEVFYTFKYLRKFFNFYLF